MKVKEMIQQLQGCNPEAEVVDWENRPFNSVSEENICSCDGVSIKDESIVVIK